MSEENPTQATATSPLHNERTPRDRKASHRVPGRPRHNQQPNKYADKFAQSEERRRLNTAVGTSRSNASNAITSQYSVRSPKRQALKMDSGKREQFPARIDGEGQPLF